MMGVGRSSRTPYKHWLLNANLGRVAGAISTGKTPVRPPLLTVDLCAGDGVSTMEHTCSPEIIWKHTKWLLKRGISARMVFIEQHPYTFALLQKNLQMMKATNFDTLNIDARDYKIGTGIAPFQPVFINCDPNKVSDMPLASEIVKSLSNWTTFIVTLGCNVGGLKRCSLEERMEWKQYVADLTANLPNWHDALLVRLIHDAAQWSYLIRLPIKWSKRHAEEAQRKGNTLFEHGVDVASLRREPERYGRIIRDSFYTHQEIKDGVAEETAC
jgi:hypothetical protein